MKKLKQKKRYRKNGYTHEIIHHNKRIIIILINLQHGKVVAGKVFKLIYVGTKYHILFLITH